MAAASHNPSFAKKAGIPVSVAKEFNQADKGKKFKEGGNVANLKKLFKGKETYSEELKEGKAIKSGKLTPQQYAKGEKMEESKKMKGGDKKMKGGGSCYAKGGVTRADGCATKGHTKGKMMAKGGKVDNTLSDRDPETGLHRNAYAFEGGDIKNKAWTKSGTSMSKKDVDSASDKELKSAARTNVDPRIKRGDVKDLEDLYEAKRKSTEYNKSRDIVDKINPEGGSSRGTDYEEGMKRGGKVKSCGMKGGGITRGDGIASRGRTRGKFV